MSSSPPSSSLSSAAELPAPTGHHRAPPGFEDVRRILVLGLSGTGKSNLMRLLSAPQSRLLVLDPNRQYTDLAVEIGSLDELDEYLGKTRKRFRIAYANDQLEADAPALFEFAYREGHLWLGIEEAAMFCDPYKISPQLKKIADYGRHPHISFLVHSRRPSQEIHHVFTSQSLELFCFRTTEPADVEWISKFAGKDFAKRLEGLPPMRCLWRNLYDGSEPPQEITPPLAKAA